MVKLKKVVKVVSRGKEVSGRKSKFPQPNDFGPTSKAFKICQMPKSSKCFKVGLHKFAEIDTLVKATAKDAKPYGGSNSIAGISYLLQREVEMGEFIVRGDGTKADRSYTYIIK